MDEAIYTEKYQGLTIKIYYDPFGDSPIEWDNFGHITGWHRQAEVKTYDDFLTGRAFGYAVLDANGETLDSCWGFYENDDADPHSGNGYVVSAAREAAHYHVKSKRTKEVVLSLSFECPICYQRNPVQDSGAEAVTCNNCNNQFKVLK